MHSPIRFAFALILSSAVVVSCRVVSIDVSVPYSSGNTWLNVGYPVEPDTIRFSNGAEISICLLTTGDLEHPIWHYSMFFVPKTYRNIGYQYNDSIRVISGTTISVGNPDTIWSQAKAFPGLVQPLDSVTDEGSGTGPRKYLGKWCFDNIPASIDLLCVLERYSILANSNAIIYLADSIGGKMKLQACAFTADKMANYTQCPVDGYWITKLDLNWATDSLGNGQFAQSTGIRNKKVSNKSRSCLSNTVARPMVVVVDCHAAKSSVGAPVFNLKGSIVRSGRLPLGVFVVPKKP